MRALRWDELRSAFGIPAHVLPDIVPCHQVAGHVTRQAAAATGLLAGTRWWRAAWTQRAARWARAWWTPAKRRSRAARPGA